MQPRRAGNISPVQLTHAHTAGSLQALHATVQPRFRYNRSVRGQHSANPQTHTSACTVPSCIVQFVDESSRITRLSTQSAEHSSTQSAEHASTQSAEYASTQSAEHPIVLANCAFKFITTYGRLLNPCSATPPPSAGCWTCARPRHHPAPAAGPVLDHAHHP